MDIIVTRLELENDLLPWMPLLEVFLHGVFMFAVCSVTQWTNIVALLKVVLVHMASHVHLDNIIEWNLFEILKKKPIMMKDGSIYKFRF